MKKERRVPLACLWWMNPLNLFLATVIPLSLFALLIPDENYVLYWRTGKHFNPIDLALMGLIALTFVLGAVVANVTNKLPRTPVANSAEEFPWLLVFRLFQAGFVMTTAGYLIWLAICIGKGVSLELLLSVLKGEEGSIYITRDLGGEALLPGVTTCTQFGMATGVLGVLIGWRFGWKKTGWHLSILATMALVRALFFSERLAFIEVSLPPAILLLRLKLGQQITTRARKILSLLPIASVAAIFILFTTTEYFRSWVNFYAAQGESIFWHSLMRLLGYYVTALNNGALYFKTIGVLDLPFYTVQWFWKFPLMPLFSKNIDSYMHMLNDQFELILTQDANLEFNNPSGTFITFSDFGLIGASVLWFSAGWIGMMLYRAFQRGTAAGLLLYPFYFIGLTEVCRIFYWGETRAFPTWLYLLATLLLVRLSPKRALSPIMARAAVPPPVATS